MLGVAIAVTGPDIEWRALWIKVCVDVVVVAHGVTTGGAFNQSVKARNETTRRHAGSGYYDPYAKSSRLGHFLAESFQNRGNGKAYVDRLFGESEVEDAAREGDCELDFNVLPHVANLAVLRQFDGPLKALIRTTRAASRSPAPD